MNYPHKIFPTLVLAGLLFPFFAAYAQDGGVAPPSDATSSSVPADVATSTVAVPPEIRGEGAQTALPATSTPRVDVPPSAPPTPTPNNVPAFTNPTPAAIPSVAQDVAPTEGTSSNPLLWVLLAAAAVLPFGYFAARSLQKTKAKEGKKDPSRCFDIKILLDEKLKKLTDLKGQLESKATNVAKETIRGAVEGTSTGEMLALIESAEKEYKKFKKLYEECTVEFGTSARVIVMHGSPSDRGHATDPATRTYDKHWMPWLKKELASKKVPVEAPLMPTPWEPNYDAYKQEFEKQSVSEKDILIGHSSSAAFLLRWLGESKQKIAKLILVAPWKIADTDNPAQKAYYEHPIDKSIKERVGEILIFTSDNEEEGGKTSAKMIHDVLGGRVMELKGRGHYTVGDMGAEQFPELLEELTKR